MLHILTVCHVLVSNKTNRSNSRSKYKYTLMQFHLFSNRKGNCTLCDIYHTFWQLCPVLDYHGNNTRQPSNAYRIHLQQGKSSDNICKSMSYESEESWYISKPFPQWYVTIILFYVTTICCKRNQVRTKEYIRSKDNSSYLTNNILLLAYW